ncbi:MAG: serine/threonine protein kinase [Actinomycetota bacterium]|nr:serine/threonine protein kinase [Actinomycetota bacterium]
MSDKAGWSFSEGDEIVPGRYALEKLGGGKRYEAYLAWDEKLFSQVVIKIVRPDQTDDPRSAQDLHREASAVAHLSHPVIVRQFGVHLEGERPHLVLEHLEGPTLRKLIKNHGRLPLEQLVPLAVQVSGALHYMASEGFVHLDVKPSNIVMSAPPRLIDLSVARTLRAAATLNKRVGTRAYMSPEQVEFDKRGPIGPPADVWGLGVTLYEAATGARAFPAPKDRNVPLPQTTEAPPPWPKDTHPDVHEILGACLAKNAEDRPAVAEVARAFEPLLSGIPNRPRLRRRRPRMA